MSSLYVKKINMCESKRIAKGILEKSTLGKKLVDRGMISYDFYDSTKDREPDEVIVSINNYDVKTFWYKFFNKDSFTLDTIEKKAKINFNPEIIKNTIDKYGPSANNKLEFDDGYCEI